MILLVPWEKHSFRRGCSVGGQGGVHPGQSHFWDKLYHPKVAWFHLFVECLNSNFLFPRHFILLLDLLLMVITFLFCYLSLTLDNLIFFTHLFFKISFINVLYFKSNAWAFIILLFRTCKYILSSISHFKKLIPSLIVLSCVTNNSLYGYCRVLMTWILL